MPSHSSSRPDEIAEPVSSGMVAAVAQILHFIAFVLAGFVGIASPWLFASWEMWWFWSVSVVLCASLALSGAATILDEAILRPNGLLEAHHRHVPTRAVTLLALCAPFLAYALMRCRYPSGPSSPMVSMEMERSLMLFFTPVGLGLSILLSSRTKWRAVLLRCIIWNFIAVCAVACLTHYVNNDTRILWVAANDFHYVGRASAPFYCPNHFVDFASFGFFILLATALTPRIRLRTLVPVVAGAAFCGFSAMLSASRGGIAAALATFALGVPCFAFRSRPRRARIALGVLSAVIVAASALAIRYTNNPVMNRLSGHNLWKTLVKAESYSDFSKNFASVFWNGFDRGQYIGAALRAWKSNPFWGIGPGQHSNRWAQFEPAPDGVRPKKADLSDMVRPSFARYEKHLYEVHSDWTQLLEEYGLCGFLLFAIPAAGLFVTLVQRIKPCANGDARTLDRALPLGALLCFIMLFFHCIFDFSLQMPALVWLFSTICVLAVLSEGEAV